MLRNWRFWVLAILLIGPPAVYIGLGSLWLMQRGWGLYAFMIWLASGVIFGLLSARWTKSARPVLPPIDWDAPRTFGPQDRKAWELVQNEAELADQVTMSQLTTADLYIDTGRRMAERLARHYHPNTTDPIEHVPVIEILTALELAAEDLVGLCREVPGGDMVTPAHWKKAVQAAGYLSKANEIYGYLLPFFQPTAGLMRLSTQKLMVAPAWKSMQQNVLRWFFRAYVNRLGTHLIELYSHRLSIGADQYRRLTRKAHLPPEVGTEAAPLVIAVAGARDSGKSALIAALEQARAGDLEPVRKRLAEGGFDEQLADLLNSAKLVEVESYTVHESEVARDRYTRRDAVAQAVEADLLLLVVDGTRVDFAADARFAEAWLEWFEKTPEREIPPALAVLTKTDRPEMTGEVEAPGSGGRAFVSRSARDAAVQARINDLRAVLPPGFHDIVPVGLGSTPPIGVSDRLLPELAPLLHRAERAGLIRHFHRHATRSKAGRFFSQVGRQGRRLWSSLASSRTRGRP